MNYEQEINNLKKRLQELEQIKSIPDYDNSNTYIPFRNITDFIQIVTSVPTLTPKNLFDSIKFYSTGGTYRLYIYDYTNNAWRYATLT